MQVTFDPTDYTVNENDGTVTLMVRKIGQSAIPVMVNITTSSGSAEGMYTIELPYASSSPPSPPHFTSPPSPSSHPSPLTHSFLSPSSLSSPRPIPFSPSLMCPLTLPYHLLFTDGMDFTGIVLRTLTFPAGGDDVIEVSIPLINDTVNEPREDFFATLFTSDRNVMIVQDTATVTIVDDDGEFALCYVSVHTESIIVFVSAPKRRDTVMGTYTSVHIAGAHARRILLTSNVHVAAPYCARQLKTQTRSCEISAREAKTARSRITRYTRE